MHIFDQLFFCCEIAKERRTPTAAKSVKCARCEGIYAIINFPMLMLCLHVKIMFSEEITLNRVPPPSNISTDFIYVLAAAIVFASLLASFIFLFVRKRVEERKKLPAIYVEIIGRHDSKASKKKGEEVREKHIKF